MLPLQIGPDFQSDDLQQSLQVYVDPTGELQFPAIRSASFQNAGQAIWNEGLSNAHYWFRFGLKNLSGSFDPVYLELYYPLLDHVALYRAGPAEDYTVSRTGDMLPFDSREMKHRNFVFQIHVPPGQTRFFYLEIHSKGVIQAPLRLQSVSEFLQSDRQAQLWQGIYFGIMLGMLLYNLFLYASVRYTGYLFYVFYIAGLALFQLIYHGYFYAMVLPSNPVLVNESVVFSINFMLFWGILFSRTFLNTQKYDRLMDWPLRILQWTAALSALSSFVLPYTLALNTSVASSVLFVFVIFFAAMRRLYHGYRPARFFLFAWTTLLIAILVLSLKQYGWLPYTFITNYSLQFGSAMEVLLLSVALGDRIKDIELEKKKAQSYAYRSMQKAHLIKDEFLYHTSMELREPIEGIVGMSEGLFELASKGQGRVGTIEQLRDGLSVISSTGTIVSGLVNDILDFYRIKNGEIFLNRASIAPDSVASVVLDLCRPWAQARGIELQIDIPESVSPIYADEIRLRQILLNLVNNGIKFTLEGHVRISAINLDRFVEFTISDTGRGIPGDALEDIFFLFERPQLAAGRKSGKGLGLTITRKLIELHGGLIRAESSDQGTNMIFTIPVSESPAPPLRARSRPERQLDLVGLAESAAGSHTIVVADNDTINLKAQERRLIQAGYNVITVGNSAALQEIMATGSPDLLIIDLYLSGQNGYEICRQLRNIYSLYELPIILVGRAGSADELKAAIENGANDYLSRPVDRIELLSRVRMLLELKESILEKEKLLSIEKELDVARSIMDRLLPANLQLPDGFSGHTLYLPAGSIGGDIYDFYTGPEWFHLLIADVTGHGVPAALFASMVKIAHTVALGQGHTTADRILWTIHETIRNHLGEHFVTAGYLRINAMNRVLQYSRAGHLPLMVMRRSTQELLELNPGGRLLGLVDDLRLETQEMQLLSGDRIFCFTDGIYETLTEDGLHLGDHELRDLIMETSESPVNLAQDRFEARLAELTSVPGQIEDDRTLIMIDVN